VDLTATAIFLLILLVLYGTARGVTTAAVIYLIALWLGRMELPLVIIHVGAIAFIGWRLRSNPQGLIVRNVVYWFFISSPLLVVYFLAVNSPLDNIAVILLQKEAAAALIFSLVADILLSYGWLNRFVQEQRSYFKGYYFKRMMIHSSLAALMIPYLIYMAVSSYSEEMKEVNSVQSRSRFTSQGQTIHKYLSNLSGSELFILKQHGLI
jgi:hypothetical protein